MVNDKIIGLEATDDRLEAAIKDSNKQISVVDNRHTTINNKQDVNIAKNSTDITNLGYRVDNMEDKFNASIANAMAFAALPSPPIAGKNMFTFGTGYHEGQAAISLGVAGSSDNGVISYKFGGSWSEAGGTSFGVGGGYMFD